MATDFVFPTSAELTKIAPLKMARLTNDRPVFDFFPMRNDDNYLVMWEQQDNYTGLAQVRGLNGEPPKVNRLGARRYQFTPGVYGEQKQVDEFLLTTRRQYGTFGTPIDIAHLVTLDQDHLLQRERDRIESIIWTLLTTGTFSVPSINGGVIHTDTLPLQTFTSGTTWSTTATATPLADLRAIQLLNRGYSVNFGATSKLYVNRVTANRLLSNTNANDVAGRRSGGFGTFNSINELNTLFTMDDLPNIVVYDEGYQAAVTGTAYSATNTDARAGTSVVAGTFTPFIPNGVGVLIGQRPAGQKVGEYLMTRNANNPGLAPGSYTKVIDRGETQVPRQIEVHQGHNGGPALYFPSAIVACTFG